MNPPGAIREILTNREKWSQSIAAISVFTFIKKFGLHYSTRSVGFFECIISQRTAIILVLLMLRK